MFWNCFVSVKIKTWSVLAILANHSRYPLFARQVNGWGRAMTVFVIPPAAALARKQRMGWRVHAWLYRSV